MKLKEIKLVDGQYTTDHVYCGKHKIATCTWNSGGVSGSSYYRIKILLPGMKDTFDVSTKDDVLPKVREVFEGFLKVLYQNE